MLPSYDILICSIEHRTDRLHDLLLKLAPQIKPRVGVKIYRDNLEHSYGEKCQALLESSSAEYVSFLDDDDMVPSDFVATVMLALRKRPDYVGFRVLFTENGAPQLPVYHSLQYDGWNDESDALYRDLVHFNPIRRTLSLMAGFEGGYAADRRWAERLRGLGCVKEEVFIDRELYEYRHAGGDTFMSRREPMPEHPARPEFSFVTYL